MILRTLSAFLVMMMVAALAHAQPRNLEIYWIDTEGGAATLIITPAGQSLLAGLDVTVLCADGKMITIPDKSEANGLCKGATQKDPDPSENARSVGFLLTYGKFKFLDLGDLTWEKEMLLACPANRAGHATI